MSVSGTGGIRDEWTGNTQKTDKNGNVFNAVFTDDKEKTVSANDFLTLMVAQLKNQDFMNPVDDTQFVTQLAQFTTMSQMQELASYSKTTYATSLVGKEVTVAKFNVGGSLDKQTGVVQRVSLVDGEFTIYVNDKPYTLDQIMEVNAAGSGSSSSDKDLMEQAAFAASLIGKELTVDDGTGKKTGVVTKSSLVDGEYKVYIGGKAYSLDDILEINGEPVIDNSGSDNSSGGSSNDDDDGDDVIDNPGTTTPPDTETPGGDSGGDIPDIERPDDGTTETPGGESTGTTGGTDDTTGTAGESGGTGDTGSSESGADAGGTSEA